MWMHPGVKGWEHSDPDLPPIRDALIWVDTFSLRQCQPDFKTAAVLQLIEDIDCFVAEVHDSEYAQRSFCVLELFAAVRCKKNIMLAHRYYTAYAMPSKFITALAQVDVASAKT